MEHVSTLCAISTVGIAPTGLAFGRVDRSSSRPGRFRKKTLPLHDQCATATDHTVSPLNTNPVPAGPYTTAIAQSHLAADFLRECEDGAPDSDQPGEARSRRKSSFAGVRLRRRGQTLTGPPRPVFENLSIASHIRRPSSSWVRRLSFQPEKRASCQTPVSPSSNGPGSPTSPAASIQRRPNKLVKRPPSHNANSHPLSGNAPPSPLTPAAFRRPATSHQRSETLGHKASHSLNFEPSLILNPPPNQSDLAALGDDHAWHPYIDVSPEGLSERLARRFSTATRPKDPGLRRIVPNADTAPALLLATSIRGKHPTVEADLDESTPSPVQFRNPFGPSGVSPQQQELPLPPEERNRQIHTFVDDAGPKCPPTSTGPADNESLKDGLLVYPKRRAISTPLPASTKSEGTLLVPSQAHGRRNITDPNIFRRPTVSQNGVPSSMMSEVIGSRRTPYPLSCQGYKLDMAHLRDIGSRPFALDAAPLSRSQGTFRQRPKSHSIAASDPASTVIGSDDTHIFTSGDEDETDFLSDTAFDSIRTHITTSSNSGPYAPRIQTIFDKEFPVKLSEGMSNMSVLETDGPLTSHSLENCQCDSDRDATPIPTPAPIADKASNMHEGDSNISFPSDLTDDEDSRSLLAALPSETTVSFARVQSSTLPLKGNASDCFRSECDSHSLANEALDSCPKMNIFDWSEQPRSDREATGPDGRPRTVHGKHAPDVRGSRAPGRKAPSTLHLRSQSVPVTRDSPAINEQRQTSGKFGTWGLGSKGVSEDWDSDFDFEDADESTTSETMKPNKTLPRRGMIVPQAIMERQASLHGQFGQVQELTLLVEELKRLRHQGSFLNLVRGPSSELWKEAEGIVNLATLDDDDHDNSPPGSPSSLTFSFDESEGDSSNTNDPWKRVSGGSWGVSFSEQSNSRPTTSPSPEVTAKPNSVLDLIYQQRNSGDSTFTESHLPRSKKLPFDTQSLRDLVVRAGVVTRALKEVIRKADGVTAEPKEIIHLTDPPFSRIFDQSSHDDASLKTYSK
ncbi:hypothetical protein ASPCADRAFT_163627 [Aspergillus carbonarius ITEM 5010]|uniref:Uncharacterized protein n=1 Tax=Aspergillus carbonarius (strain ITEM 5010) TaxID=602072 RepID=A0A1R3RT76_ASPC5|nr:hypothetical protein ASPCADRAFT_163492 [Aspergillus carbonarius ITEM 5010]OOF97721.1 hypothetical protein ASPCADRAFT_163627 [Aspergillus carbonarius ITEM 5010]